MQGTLVVEDGTTAEGVFFGSNRRVFGELVFNTNMTGYTEALTDPSYRGQILMMTYPLIGNYGVDPASMESGEIQVTGFVVKEACPVPVHPKASMDVGRKITIARGARGWGGFAHPPSDAAREDTARHKPSGVIISNGPGDPAHPEILRTSVRTAREIASEYPILGICLGHQVLGLAFGGTTYKLKFGHRGGNQPVKDLRSGRVHITSQNHGFAVDAKSMEASEFEITHLNLNDNTMEGMIHKELPVFSVQYHPEAHPGPWDNEYIFREFAAMARK